MSLFPLSLGEQFGVFGSLGLVLLGPLSLQGQYLPLALKVMLVNRIENASSELEGTEWEYKCSQEVAEFYTSKLS